MEHLGNSIRDESRAVARGFARFLLRGNVVDLAVAVVIGAAAGNAITAFVRDIFSPLLSVAFGRHESATKAYFTLRGNNVMYGDFLNNLISFLIVAAVVYFFVIMPSQKLAANERWAAIDTDRRTCPECLSEIPVAARRCAFCTAELATR